MQPDALIGLAFPVIRVRYAGPTDHRGSRYIARLRGPGPDAERYADDVASSSRPEGV